MRQIYFSLVAVLFFTQSIKAQFVDFSFEHSEKEYKSLVGATDITSDFEFDGDYLYLTLGLETPVNLATSEGIFSVDTILIYATEMEIYLYKYQPELDIETNLLLSPYDLLLESTQLDGIEENETEIYYLYEEGISYFEFKNMMFYLDELNDLYPETRITFTVSIRHSDGRVNYHYGPSNNQPSAIEILEEEFLIFIDLIQYSGFEVYNQIGIVSDSDGEVKLYTYSDYNEFDGTGLSYFPAPNTLYSFFLGETTSQNLHAVNLDVKVFPNPTFDNLHINFDSTKYNGSIEIYNSSGQMILTNLPLTSQVIPVGNFTPGLYTINFITDKGFQSMKWMKI